MTSPLPLRAQIASAIPRVLALVALVWVVEAVNLLSGYALNRFGIVPRTVTGLVGIPLCPFLHASIGHAVSNTVPLVVLGSMVSMRGAKAFYATTIAIVVLGGLGVWLLAGGGVHVGASGLVFGYFGFLVACAWYEREVGSIAIAAIILLLYSGLIWGVLPGRPGVSWQGHLFGLLAGALFARLQSSTAMPRRS